EAARQELAAGQKARRQHEGELQDLEAKRSRLKGQLMEVKTNKEYTAMLHEIEAVERDIRAREDQILSEMERGETLAVEVKREEDLYRQAEERHRTQGRALDERARALGEQAGRLGAERDAVAATVPPGVLELFHRVARLRGGRGARVLRLGAGGAADGRSVPRQASGHGAPVPRGAGDDEPVRAGRHRARAARAEQGGGPPGQPGARRARVEARLGGEPDVV